MYFATASSKEKQKETKYFHTFVWMAESFVPAANGKFNLMKVLVRNGKAVNKANQKKKELKQIKLSILTKMFS